MKLLKKELLLCMHPSAYMMLCLSAMVLIPNYPYSVAFFYMTLAVFFVCLSGRENHDATYTACLPVSRSEAVKGRICFACCLECSQIFACFLFIFLKRLIGTSPNEVGMDANIALLGEGFLVFGVFNLLFFPAWYRDISKVGKPFILASTTVFAYIAAAICSCYAVPFVRERLDTPDPEHMAEKLLFLAVCAAVYTVCTVFSLRCSSKKFEKLDLQLQ